MKTHSQYIVKPDSVLTVNRLEQGLAIKIKDGYIDDIDNAGAFSDDIEALYFTGYNIAPCFCDRHIHLRGSKRYVSDTLVSNGITAVWDGGSKDCDIPERENALSVRTAGCALYKKGGYGKYIGRGVEKVQEAEDIIDALLQNGANYIKVVNSGAFMAETGGIPEGGFNLQELTHIVSHARSRGLDVACHSNGEKAVYEAVEAGVSFIIHGLRIANGTIDLMAEKGTAFIPTVNAFASLKKISKGADSIKNIEEAVEQHLGAIKYASDKGVRVLAGSDAGASFIPYGASFHEELALFEKAGIPEDRIISSAVTGWLEKGAKADFLVLDGLSVKEVFIDGRRIKE